MNKLCECGCGKEVKIGRDSKQYNRFVLGHNCPHKGHKQTEKWKINLSNRSKENTYSKGIKRSLKTKDNLSKSHLGKKFSNNHKQKLSLTHIGHIHSKETKNKISENNGKGMLGKTFKHSIETKNKISISTIKYISKTKFDGGPMYPRIGKNEISIIDQLSILTNIEFIKNNYNLALQIGKFPDAYSSKYNLVIEVLENHHFKTNGELSDYDQNRELIIAQKLGCMIYYIPEQEFLKNPEKEIQRFKDFILIL